ncbi:MAG: ROK family protein [Mucilaginibacter polytrichastri]|nr:ROK family protein [Mucilaginibacter polytrichastri]
MNRPRNQTVKKDSRTLSIDIGGSHIKSTILSPTGEMLISYEKTPTPMPSTPENMLDAIQKLVSTFPEFDQVSVGFPGFVKNGTVMTAPNLGNEAWQKFHLQRAISTALGKPAQVVNDADMQGLGVVAGKGLEMVVTLGTGFGTALLFNGELLPHFEIAHHPVKDGKDYDEYIGDAALEAKGEKDWNRRMKKVLKIIKTVFNYDHLYIGGGNARKLDFKLPKNITLVSNRDGIKGGARLWHKINA